VDECAENNGGCSQFATCINLYLTALPALVTLDTPVMVSPAQVKHSFRWVEIIYLNVKTVVYTNVNGDVH